MTLEDGVLRAYAKPLMILNNDSYRSALDLFRKKKTHIKPGQDNTCTLMYAHIYNVQHRYIGLV